MTKDERQLIRMMNRSFKDKKNSRNIEVNDLSESIFDKITNDNPIKPYTSDFCSKIDLDNPLYDGTLDLPKENESNICAINPENLKLIPITEDEIQKLVKECTDKIREKIKNASTLYEIKIDGSLDDMEIDEITDDDYRPLIQHFVLSNPWLPYEKDIKLTKFIIHQDSTVDLEFDIKFNIPPHLKHEPTDLNNPLKILKNFKNLMGKSNADGDNIKCSIIYTDTPDYGLAKDRESFLITGKITSMEILQSYGLGLKITIKGKITNHDETRC